jgi:hypothetical protein
MDNLKARRELSANKFHPLIIVLVFAVSFFLLHPAVTPAQPPADKNQSGKTAKPKAENPALVRWKIFLDSLAQEARTVFPEERRPYAIVEAANAYWEVDREASRLLYISALDAALSLTRQNKKYRGLVNYVLASATRRDVSLAKELNKRLLEEEGDLDNISSEIALDLLEEDAAAAARLAEAFAPNGLQDGSAAFFIFSLARQDIRLSDSVYNVYLNKVGLDAKVPLESIVTLAGYSFGYPEYYSVDKRGQLGGGTFMPVAGLSANEAFTRTFLSLAYRRIGASIEIRNRAVGAEVEGLNFPILFALEYLMPEVAKFRPNVLGPWQQLQQQGMAGVTAAQIVQVQNYVRQIHQSRARTQKTNDGPQTPEQEAEASLENVEKLPGTCQRDIVYSKAALVFAYRENFKRALELAGEIEDLKQGASVKEAISMDMIGSAIKSGEFEEAEKKIEKISSPEHKARLYAELAQALAGKNDYRQANGILDEAIKLTEKLPNAGDRAAIFFSISTILLKTDPIEAQTVLRNAVKNLNKLEPADQMIFSIQIKVPLSCPGEEETWYGGYETLPNSNVFEALALLANQNPDQATGLADEIGDKITKVRALAVITKVALVNLRVKPKNKLNVSGN